MVDNRQTGIIEKWKEMGEDLGHFKVGRRQEASIDRRLILVPLDQSSFFLLFFSLRANGSGNWPHIYNSTMRADFAVNRMN